MKTISVFLGVDMRLGHDGLRAHAKVKKVNMDELNSGEAIIFINAKRTMMKSYSYNKVISFVRSKDINRPIDLTVLDYLPKSFNVDGTMDYPKALKMVLENKLQGKHKLEPEYLNGDSKVKKDKA